MGHSNHSYHVHLRVSNSVLYSLCRKLWVTAWRHKCKTDLIRIKTLLFKKGQGLIIY
jgi:hypothetical protein